MVASRVWIRYKPRLYSDLLRKVFQSLGPVEVIEDIHQEFVTSGSGAGMRMRVDVIVLPLDDWGLPEIENLPRQHPEAKLVAFSPKGDYGMRRLPGESHWERFQPCELTHLVDEVLRVSHQGAE